MLPPLSHLLISCVTTTLQDFPKMGSQGVLPGLCSGKQDTTEHTWAEVKAIWAASAWQGASQAERGCLELCVWVVNKGYALQDMFTLFCAHHSSVTKLQSRLCSDWGRRVHLWGDMAFLWPALIPSLGCPRSPALCGLWTSATPLVCLVLVTFPFHLLLFDPTIGFSLPPLCGPLYL